MDRSLATPLDKKLVDPGVIWSGVEILCSIRSQRKPRCFHWQKGSWVTEKIWSVFADLAICVMLADVGSVCWTCLLHSWKPQVASKAQWCSEHCMWVLPEFSCHSLPPFCCFVSTESLSSLVWDILGWICCVRFDSWRHERELRRGCSVGREDCDFLRSFVCGSGWLVTSAPHIISHDPPSPYTVSTTCARLK